MRTLLPLFLTIFFGISANGQAFNVNIKSWGIQDGLSNRQVNYICKDTYGFIWLCTPKGLNRFDGYGFKIYNTEKGNLPFDDLSGMVLDNNGCFWIMGSDFYQTPVNNLFIFDPVTGRSVSFKDKTGFSENFRFNLLQKFNDTTLFFGSSQESHFFTWSEKAGLHKYNYPVAVARWITWSSNSTFWVLDNAGHYCEIDMTGQLLQQCTHNADSLDLAPPLTVGTYSITRAMPGQKITSKPITDITVDNGVASLCMHTANDQYLPSANPDKYDLGGILLQEIKARLDPLHYTYSTHVLIVSNKEVLISSGFGLVRVTITKNRFRRYFYQESNNVSNNSFRTLLVDHNTLYAVNESTGIQQVNLATGAQQMYSPPFSGPNRRLFSLARTSDGRLFGLREGELYIRDQHWSALTIDQLDKKKADTPSDPGITWKITEIAKDSFLLAGWQGLKYYNLRQHRYSNFTRYNAFASLARSLVIDIIDDKQGYKWVCSNSGLYRYDTAKGIIARYSSADTGAFYLPSLDIHHVCRDTGEVYWLGTANGLIRWDKARNKYRLFTVADGLSNNNIYAAYEDHRHRLWLTSDYGLMQLDKTTLQVKTYLAGDGISYNEFNRLSHTCDAAGNLYFGTLNGVTSFNPDDFIAEDSLRHSPLAVASLEQFDSRTGQLTDRTAQLLQTSLITLRPGDRFFNLGLALLTFDDALHTTYYWKINEVDTAWTAFKEPVLRLSGLPYGRLILHIKAQESDGSWGSNELQFMIDVIRPLYLRTWFIVLALLAIAAGIFIAYQWRTWRLHQENRRLDSIVRQKTAELKHTIRELELSSRQKDVLLKEIHHRVKNNLQVISTLLNLQLASIADEKARRSLEESASRINSIALVHFQLYHKEEITAIELSNFISELLQQVSSVYLKPWQDINLLNEVQPTWLDIDTALPLGLLLNELMTNSFKYAYPDTRHCSMRIELDKEGDTFTLRYSDNGPGLPEGYRPETGKTLGMTLIKSLARQLAGDFSYNRQDNCFLIRFRDTQTRKNIA